MRSAKNQRNPGPSVRLTLRQLKLLRLIAARPRTAGGLRAELYGANGTRLAVTESRNVTAGLAVLAAGGLVLGERNGSFAITRMGRLRLERP